MVTIQNNENVTGLKLARLIVCQITIMSMNTAVA